MKLYVCYGTWKPAPRPGGHPCGNAYHALKDAGYEPEVKRSYGLGPFPSALISLMVARISAGLSPAASLSQQIMGPQFKR